MFALKNKNNNNGAANKPEKAKREPTHYNQLVKELMPYYNDTLGLPVTVAMKHIAQEHNRRKQEYN
jgi:hypothetical protein